MKPDESAELVVYYYTAGGLKDGTTCTGSNQVSSKMEESVKENNSLITKATIGDPDKDTGTEPIPDGR